MPPSQASMNALKVQSSIKNNAEELGQYLREMGAWENSVKKRDKVLAAKRSNNSSPAVRPPVRAGGGLVPVGTTAQQALAAAPEPTPLPPPVRGQSRSSATMEVTLGSGGATEKTSAAQHTYDKGYKKWENFDISAAERAVDDSNNSDDTLSAPTHEPFHNGEPVPLRRPASNRRSSKEIDEAVVRVPRTPADVAHAPMAAPTASGGATVPKPRPALMSVQEREVAEREKGNALFQKGEFTGAAKCYTACLGLNNRSVAAFSNRALCMLKLKEWRRAEADASLALLHDPRHVKSLQRRAAARSSMGLHRAALADLAAAAVADELHSNNNNNSSSNGSSSSSGKSIQAETRKVKELLRATMRHAPRVQVRVNLALSAPMPQPTPPPELAAPQVAPPPPAPPAPAPESIAAPEPKPASTSNTRDEPRFNPAKVPSSAEATELSAAAVKAPAVASIDNSSLNEGISEVTGKEKHTKADYASAPGSSEASVLPAPDAASFNANDSSGDRGGAVSATTNGSRTMSPNGAMDGGKKATPTGVAAAVSPSGSAAKPKAVKVVDPKGPFELERMWRLCGTKIGSGSGGSSGSSGSGSQDVVAVEKRRLAHSLLRPDGKVARVLFGPKALTTMDADLLCDLLLRRLDVVPTAAPGTKGSKLKGTEDPANFQASFAVLAAAPRLARSAAFLSASQRESLAAALDARASALGDVLTSLRDQLLG